MTDIVLDGVLGEIQEVAGLAAALQICAVKGGGPAYFCSPDRLTEDNWLVQAVGWNTARLLAIRFCTRAGGQIKIPQGPNGSRRKQWVTIRRMLADGMSAIEVARALGIDEKTVRRHRTGKSGKARPADPRQGTLL